VGNLTSLDDGRGITTYTYDNRNLLSSMTPTNGTVAQGCIQSANLTSWGGTFTPGGGGSSPSAGVSIGVQGSNASTISALRGPFIYGGGSIGDGIAGSVSGFSGGGAYGGDASIGLFANVPFPFSVFGGYSYTWTF
jgi:YD repeat-containing protein